MSIWKKLAVLTAVPACIAVANLEGISPAVAITLNVNGNFDDGGAFTGTFTVDLNSFKIPDFDITTTPGNIYLVDSLGIAANSGEISGIHYTSSEVQDTADAFYEKGVSYFTFYSPASAWSPNSSDTFSAAGPSPAGDTLSLSFEGYPDSSFTGGTLINSSETTMFGGMREVVSGSLVEATPVPFEFSPGLGILALGACGAISQLKSKMQKRKALKVASISKGAR